MVSYSNLLYSLAHIGIIGPSVRVVHKWNPIFLFHPQPVFIQDTVDSGQADPVNVCKMDPVSDFPQNNGIIYQNHADHRGLLLVGEFLGSATSCWLSFYSVKSIYSTYYRLHIL